MDNLWRELVSVFQEEDSEVTEGEREGIGGCSNEYGFGTSFTNDASVDS